MSLTSKISTVIRTLGVMGIMLALAGFMASASTASAARVAQGKLDVYAFVDPSANTPPTIQVLVTDRTGKIVAKGEAGTEGNFSAKLAQGEYKVNITASGYKPYSEMAYIVANETITFKAALVVEDNSGPMPVK